MMTADAPVTPATVSTLATCQHCHGPLRVFDQGRTSYGHRYAAVCTRCGVGLEFVVTGAADNDAGVGIFLSRLAADKSWKSVRLAGLEANEQTGVRFSLKLWLN